MQWNSVIKAKQYRWIKTVHDGIQIIRAKAIKNTQEREKFLIFFEKVCKRKEVKHKELIKSFSASENLKWNSSFNSISLTNLKEHVASYRDIVSYSSPIQPWSWKEILPLIIVQLQEERSFSKLHKQQLSSKPHWLPVEMKCHINICVFIYLLPPATHTRTSLVSYTHCVGREWENSSWEPLLPFPCKKGGSLDCSWGLSVHLLNSKTRLCPGKRLTHPASFFLVENLGQTPGCHHSHNYHPLLTILVIFI